MPNQKQYSKRSRITRNEKHQPRGKPSTPSFATSDGVLNPKENKDELTTKVPMLIAQMQVMLLWFIGGALFIIVAFIQIQFGHYGDKGQEVLAWLLPLLVPTISLVAGVWAKNIQQKSHSKKMIERKTLGIVLVASLFYLFFVGLAFAIQPFVTRPPLEVIQSSGLILGPLQGVVSVFLGIFFTQDTNK